MEAAAKLLGRPFEVDGVVVGGDRRGGTLGFPTANLRVEPTLLVPAYGIYAGAVDDRRAAVSIGVNPHYGGTERRIEAYLLDWEGDLYGDRLVVELWRRLRDERAFESEAELIAQIARDVEETRAATRPPDDAARKRKLPAAGSLSAAMDASRQRRCSSSASAASTAGRTTSSRPTAAPCSQNPGCPRCGYVGLDPRDDPASSLRATAPLRRGSAPAPARPTALTPPK